MSSLPDVDQFDVPDGLEASLSGPSSPSYRPYSTHSTTDSTRVSSSAPLPSAPGSPSVAPDGRCNRILFLSNLSHSWSPYDLDTCLNNTPVSMPSSRLVLHADKRCTGYGFGFFRTHRDAEKAIQIFADRRILARFAYPTPVIAEFTADTKSQSFVALDVKRISAQQANFTEEELKQATIPFGQTAHITVRQHQATVEFRHPLCAAAAFNHWRYEKTQEFHTEIAPATANDKRRAENSSVSDPNAAVIPLAEDKRRSLYSTLFRRDVSDQEIRSYFEQFGKVEDLTTKEDKRIKNTIGCAFITYSSHEEAVNALKACQGVQIPLSREPSGLRIHWSERTLDGEPQTESAAVLAAKRAERREIRNPRESREK
jgi:RNA recognition motif-containing protein